MELKRVVITGLGALTAIGNTVDEYWQNLLAGKSGAAPISYFDASGFKTQFACELKQFDIGDHLDRKEARHADPFSQYALVAVEEALRNAAVDVEQVNRDRVGVIWATAVGGITTTEEQLENYIREERGPRFSPFYIPKMLLDSSSGVISLKHGFRGVNYNTVSACASSNAALVDAFNLLRLGKADIIVSGGSEAPITPSMIGGFNAAKALSSRNEDPATASRPFDVERDGFVIGEGAGALILEEYKHAVRRGAHIYAELIGGGVSADAYHATAAHPEGIGASLSMQAALDDAELTAADIDYVNAHATSTPLGDVSEIKAMQRVLGNHLANINISATKSMTGHLLGAAGAIEAIACALTIAHGEIPPTINTEQVDPEVPAELNLTLANKVTRPVKVAMSNSFGFGGHNATIILSAVRT
ncbi:MAG: beta-ketoacyl-ACP synthase II [Caldilineaceae bacterium]|nr:beta-ketoacyl-ACP synthase II [Caldilineaceae bacterium]